MKLFWVCLASFLFTTIARADYKNESELSMVKTGGNAVVQTTNAKTTNMITMDKNKTIFGGHYTYGETDLGVSVRNWDINGKYERELSSNASVIMGEVIEGNKFIGLNARYNTDLGLQYSFIKNDKKNLFTSLGYRYTIEDRIDPLDNTYDNKARLYNEFNHKYSETVQYKAWLEVVPNFTRSKDYLVNGEVSLTSILSSMFSLKVAYLGMYDNEPAIPGNKNYDFATTTSLVAKF